MTTNNRYSHIDLLKCIAIFFVVLYHSTVYSYSFLTNDTWQNYALYYGRTLLSTCAPLFFFVNGFLLLSRPFDLRKHVRKTIRLVILTFVWMSVLIIFYSIMSDDHLSVKDAALAVLNLSQPWGMNVFWYLGVLVSIYVIFPALKLLYDQNHKAFVYVTGATAVLTFGPVFANELLIAGSVISHRWLGTVNYQALTMFNPFSSAYGYTFVYFCVGGLMHRYEGRLLAVPAGKRNALSIFGIFLCCGILFAFGVFYSRYGEDGIWDVVWNGYNTVFTLCNVVFLYTLCLNFRKDISFIRLLSCNTLGIYLIHVPLIRLTRPWVRSIDGFRNLPANLVYALLLICVSLVFSLTLKKIPLLRKLV